MRHILLLIICATVLQLAHADSLYLRDGGVLTGTVARLENAVLTVLLSDGRTIETNVALVSSIAFANAPSTTTRALSDVVSHPTLTGEPLVAWKLARSAAINEWGEFWDFDSSRPSSSNATQTETGDYIISLQARGRARSTRGEYLNWGHMTGTATIRVVDLGTELRVDKKEFRNDKARK